MHITSSAPTIVSKAYCIKVENLGLDPPNLSGALYFIFWHFDKYKLVFPLGIQRRTEHVSHINDFFVVYIMNNKNTWPLKNVMSQLITYPQVKTIYRQNGAH